MVTGIAPCYPSTEQLDEDNQDEERGRMSRTLTDLPKPTTSLNTSLRHDSSSRFAEPRVALTAGKGSLWVSVGW